MIWNRNSPHRGDRGKSATHASAPAFRRNTAPMLWCPCILAILLSSCRPAEPTPTAIHAADCGRASEAKLPISDQRLRAEIEQRADLAPGGYTIHSRCRLDTGQFVVTIVLDVEPRAAGPSQTQTFLIQPDGRVEQVHASGPPPTSLAGANR